jgi:hypothetical protein
MSTLKEALDAVGITIVKYSPQKQRSVFTNTTTMAMENFRKLATSKLLPLATRFPDILAGLSDAAVSNDMVLEYAESENILDNGGKKKVDIAIPPDMENLTLNINLSAKGRDDRLFLTHEDETVSKVSGEIYMLIRQLSPIEAAASARKVIPEYRPRDRRGVFAVDNGGKTETIFNTYNPPLWRGLPDWRGLYDGQPKLFTKLIEHLFPIKEEREYLYAWMYESLFGRAPVFLVLCGEPGTGKNRLKLILRALHGHSNTVDGKKSTLVERFNSQVKAGTLLWFDELSYDMDMENNMKELQNDSIAIESKGIDATTATKIYASSVISNNRPRDNFITHESRKFVPLSIRPSRLEVSMTPEEIKSFTEKVEDPTAPTFDIKFIAQIAKWIKKHGKSNKWPNLEYRGPMFWALAHTSMTRWQKKAIQVLLDPLSMTERMGFDKKENSFLWSTLHDKSLKRNGDRSLIFPDFTSVKAFFEVFRDSTGKKVFSTSYVPGQNIVGDFWVKFLFKTADIVTESSIGEQRKAENDKRKKEVYDFE